MISLTSLRESIEDSPDVILGFLLDLLDFLADMTATDNVGTD